MERDFCIDGIKSWIHCLHICLDPPVSPPSLYHYHHYIELLYSLHSGATIRVNDQSYDFTDGDLLVINSGEAHKVLPVTHSDYICIKFSPHILYTSEQALLEYKYVMPFLSVNDDHKRLFTAKELSGTTIPSLCKDIAEEWAKKETAFELVIRADILKLFSQIFRIDKENHLIAPSLPLTDALKAALTYIGENYSTVTEREAAVACGLSYNYFSSAFKKATGQSFSDYLTVIRLKEAEKLLVSSDASVTEIAYAVGFSDTSHFISRFKDYRQTTPGRFRSKMQSL